MTTNAGGDASANMSNSRGPRNSQGDNQGVSLPGTYGNPIKIPGDSQGNPIKNSEGDDSNNNEDNNGQQSTLEALYNPTKKDGEDSPQGNNNSQEGDQPKPANPMEGIQKTLENLSFSPALSAEIQAELQEGKSDGFNKAMDTLGKEAVQESLNLTAQMLSQIVPALQAQMAAEIQQALGAQKGFNSLEEAIPQVKNPALRGVIEPIYEKALASTGGDHDAAISITKKALGEFNSVTAEHADVTTVPINEGSQPAQNHLDWMSRG